MNYGDYTWLAAWNGKELRAVNKSQFATASAGVTASGSNYVRFGNGTQICWGITNCGGKDTTIYLGAAFNNSSYSVNVTQYYANVADTYWNVNSESTTSFVLHASRGSAAGRNMCWMAIGTWK